VDMNKKLSCHRETARRFVSLNILLSHSRPVEMTLVSRDCVSPYYYSIENERDSLLSEQKWFLESLPSLDRQIPYDGIASHCKCKVKPYCCRLWAEIEFIDLSNRC